MTDTYTPSTEEVREALGKVAGQLFEIFPGLTQEEAEARFDRWLADHEREVVDRELMRAAQKLSETDIRDLGSAVKWLRLYSTDLRVGHERMDRSSDG